MAHESDKADDWRQHADWPEQLLTRLGEAAANESDQPMLDVLAEVDGLLSSGHEWAALVVAQAGLYRAARGRVVRGDFDVTEIVDPVAFEAREDEALAGARTPLGAAALAAAARVESEQNRHDRARDLHLAAADRWAADSMSRDQGILELLRAGASALQHGSVEDGAALSLRARHAYAEADNAEGVVWAILNLAQAETLRGDGDAARQLLDEARTLGLPLRDGHITSSILLEEALLQADQGEAAAAQNGLRIVYGRARRRKDFDQALIAAKNLAVISEEENQSRRAVRWWGAAAQMARDGRDWREEQEIERARGVACARVALYDDAIAAFDRAIEINEQNESLTDASRARADKGATLIDRAMRETLSDDRFAELTKEGIAVLDQARAQLEQHEDFEWAAIAARNLRTGWVLINTEAEGATVLVDAAEHLGPAADEYIAELHRNAAWLLLSAGTATADDPRPVQWLIAAATTKSADDVDAAWSLASQAATLAARGFDRQALDVYDSALQRLSPADDPSAYGNILNDSVLVLARLGDLAGADERLREVERLAQRAKDRVLLSLALSNLGETAARQDEMTRAQDYFRRSIKLAEDIGDDARAASDLASLARALIGQDRTHEADEVSQRAVEVAVRSGSDDAWITATSARASVAYEKGDYPLAYRLWIDCIDRESGEDRAEHEAFALDALAQFASWSRFERELDRYTRRSQRAGTQLAFVDKLYHPALSWLRREKFVEAGRVLAYGVLLAMEGASIGYGHKGRDLSSADREQMVMLAVGPIGAVRAVMLLMELPAEQVAEVRRAYETTIRNAAGSEDAELIIQTVDERVYDDTLDD